MSRTESESRTAPPPGRLDVDTEAPGSRPIESADFSLATGAEAVPGLPAAAVSRSVDVFAGALGLAAERSLPARGPVPHPAHWAGRGQRCDCHSPRRRHPPAAGAG